LYQFHDENKVAKAKQQRPLGQGAYISRENAALQGLPEMNRDLIQVLGQRCPEQQIGAADQGATIMESRKREASLIYQGERGFQPMLGVWAETDVVLADQFGDGNVPAQMETLELAKGAFAALPAGATGPARAEMRRGSLSTDYPECFGDNQKQQGGLAQKVTLRRSISFSHYTGCQRCPKKVGALRRNCLAA
jgi:hypothetical protein